MKKLYTFWCGWEADDNLPDAHMVAKWPTGMKGWLSGNAETFSIWVARVDADSAEEAEKTIRKCYGHSGEKIRMRWEPERKPHGYRLGGRFPE